MKIIKDDKLKSIKEIVQSKAKFQKVMLLFDDTISNLEIAEIYESIKEFCVYNQMNISNLDEKEIFNGYRLIIYNCSIESFMKCGFERDEFVNVYIAQNNSFLPYFLTQNCFVDKENNYLLIENNLMDLQMLCSLWFNKFFNYFKSLINGEHKSIELPLQDKETTQLNIFECVNTLSEDFEFVDVKILKKENLDYKNLMMIDVVLINAFLIMLEALKSQTYMLVDVYKASKQEEAEIDKFYKLYHNENFINLVILNYNCLHNFCLKVKSKILEFAEFCECNIRQVDELIDKVKNYAKKDNEILAYLYLYDIFSV